MTIPTLDRTLQLRFIADWGDANLHRVAGWISYEVITHTRPHTRTAIWSGVGGFDAAFAVGRGEVDIGLATPSCYVELAHKGIGPFANERIETLRGLAVIPQYDRLILGVRKSLGIRSLADIRERRFALRLALSADDGRSHFGFAAHRVLEAHGISIADLQAWGGSVFYGERPNVCLSAMLRGEVDAVLHEAIMSAGWRELVSRDEIVFLSFEPHALSVVQDRFGLPPAVLPKGYYAGQDADVAALEFSDFLVYARADLPDDVAYLVTAAMVETRARFEGAFRHIPVERSPVTYPLEPRAMARTPIPLHPGAERYYRENQLL